MNVEQLLTSDDLGDEIKKVLREQDLTFNPGRGKTALEAYIQQQEELLEQFYGDLTDEDEDPFEALVRKEEHDVAVYGRNLNQM